jgi:class 3 adenylate cyclase
VVKQIDDRILIAFDDCEVAVRAALALAETNVKCGDGPGLVPRIGVHRGAALATTLNDHLDYFGNSVNRAFRLLNSAQPGDVVLSQEVSADLSVNQLLQLQELPTETVCTAQGKSGDEIVQRVRPRTNPARRSSGPAASSDDFGQGPKQK